MSPVYLDYNATTPLDPAVRSAMLPFFEGIWGNPSSVHQIGQAARAALDDCRYRLARLWHAKPGEVVFTSGGTEANNLAIFGTARFLRAAGRGRHLITSPVEHHAVLHAFQYLARHEGFEITYLPVDDCGRVRVSEVAAALRPDTGLVSVMAANNEVGTIQPVAEIGALCREKKVLFHTDAVQAFGKLSFQDIHQFQADLVSVCAHKFYGPKGAGALYIRSPLLPHPTQLGGGHENERRAGTENLLAIVGLVAAFERFVPTPVFPAERLASLRRELGAAAVAIAGVTLRGDPENGLPNTVAFTVTGTDSIALLAGLDLAGVCGSSGSACSAGSIEPSHVLQAMRVPAAEANALVRLSLGRETTVDDVNHTIRILPEVIQRLRRTSTRR